MMPSSNKPFILAFLGTGLIMLGSLLCICWPAILERFISKELSLSPSSKSYEIWKDSGNIPLHMEIYFFNWTNPHELKIPGKKPSFVQLGPYTFLEKREKVNVIFHAENSTVSYEQKRSWYFDQSKSNGSLKDNVTQLNVVSLSAVHKVRHWYYIAQKFMSAAALYQITELHVTKTVGELLFEGYSDPLIDLGKLGGYMVDIPPFDKFGWFYMRNHSTAFDGRFNMATGQDDVMNLGILRNWNYENNSNFYESPCNAIEGSAGEFWPPHRSKEDITLFSADICRPLTYEYQETVQHYGISGYKYTIGDKTLSNSTKRRYRHEQTKYFEPATTTSSIEDFFELRNDSAANGPAGNYDGEDVVDVGHCFCSGDCTPSGLINVTACRYGAPAFVSLPHFHKADPIYRQQVDGMTPSDDKHGFSITLEPATGIPLDVAARLQVNILLQPSPYISLYEDVPKIYFPMFWFNEHAGITKDLAFSLKLLLNLPTIGFYSSMILVIVGGLILIAAGVTRFVQKRRDLKVTQRMRIGISPTQKTELIYLDTTVPNDDNQMRFNRQLYPKLNTEKNNL